MKTVHRTERRSPPWLSVSICSILPQVVVSRKQSRVDITGLANSSVRDLSDRTVIPQGSSSDPGSMSLEQVLDLRYEKAIRCGDSDLARHYLCAIMEEAIKASQNDEGLS